MELHALQPGYLLAEYRIEKLLGEGGFGLTYLALDTYLEKNVAIKEYMPMDFAWRQHSTTIVPKSEAAKTDYEWGLQAFINEAKTLARFDDPNIVRIFRFFELNGTAYLVMEYCEGGCLNDRFSVDKTLSEEAVRLLLTPLMNGLQLVHDGGVYHRDIKPDNIMFRADGTPVLIDFGAARQNLGAKSRSITTIVTPGYAPLEQYSSKGKLGAWTDIYSLAAVAYACLTGKRPPDATERIIDDEIEPFASSASASAFLKTIDKALAVKAADRPQNLVDWYAAWGNSDEVKGKPKPAQDDFTQLDDVIKMAGADGVISRNGMNMLLDKAKGLGLDAENVQHYIVGRAQQRGWQLQLDPQPQQGETPKVDWGFIEDYHPETNVSYKRLLWISPDLARQFKSHILESKEFETSSCFAKSIEDEYITRKFGFDAKINEFARWLISEGIEGAFSELRSTVSTLGETLDSETVLRGLIEKFGLKFVTETEKIKHLYTAVSSSKIKKVEELLSQDRIRSAITLDHKNQLLRIAKKRGDKKLYWLLNKV
jgi:serine/threonine protein kinase